MIKLSHFNWLLSRGEWNLSDYKMQSLKGYSCLRKYSLSSIACLICDDVPDTGDTGRGEAGAPGYTSEVTGCVVTSGAVCTPRRSLHDWHGAEDRARPQPAEARRLSLRHSASPAQYRGHEWIVWEVQIIRGLWRKCGLSFTLWFMKYSCR